MKRSFVTVANRDATLALDPAMPPRDTLSVHLTVNEKGESEIAGVYYCTPEGHVTSELTEDALRALARVDDAVRSRSREIAVADVAQRSALGRG